MPNHYPTLPGVGEVAYSRLGAALRLAICMRADWIRTRSNQAEWVRFLDTTRYFSSRWHYDFACKFLGLKR